MPIYENIHFYHSFSLILLEIFISINHEIRKRNIAIRCELILVSRTWMEKTIHASTTDLKECDVHFQLLKYSLLVHWLCAADISCCMNIQEFFAAFGLVLHQVAAYWTCISEVEWLNNVSLYSSSSHSQIFLLHLFHSSQCDESILSINCFSRFLVDYLFSRVYLLYALISLIYRIIW